MYIYIYIYRVNLSDKDRLELVHSRVSKEQRRVVQRDHRRRVRLGVRSIAEELEERLCATGPAARVRKPLRICIPTRASTHTTIVPQPPLLTLRVRSAVQVASASTVGAVQRTRPPRGATTRDCGPAMRMTRLVGIRVAAWRSAPDRSIVGVGEKATAKRLHSIAP